MFESFNDLCGSRRFVNFPNFNPPAKLEAESDFILGDPLETRDIMFNWAEMKWPLVDRAGIEEGNFFSNRELKRRIGGSYRPNRDLVISRERMRRLCQSLMI
jgi:hypothetical protein